MEEVPTPIKIVIGLSLFLVVMNLSSEVRGVAVVTIGGLVDAITLPFS